MISGRSGIDRHNVRLFARSLVLYKTNLKSYFSEERFLRISEYIDC